MKHPSIVSGFVVLLLCLAVGLSATVVRSRPRASADAYQVAGQFGGASYAVALRQAEDGVEQPPYLILGVGPRLVVMDATNPEQPVKVGQSEILPGVVRALALSDSLVFAATGLGGLQVIDLAEPTQPAVIASYDTGAYLEDLAVAGSVVYLANTPKWDGSNWVGASLQVVDVSDPRQLRLLGGYDTPGYEHGVAAAGGLVFVADGDGGLRVLEGANPAALREVGAYDTPGYALDVATDGKYAYVADFTEGVRVVDVGDPANPKEVGFVETPGKAGSVTLSGETVYVADGEGGLRVVEVGQPEGAREVGALQVEGDVRGVAAASAMGAAGVVYVADRQGGLRVVALSDPRAPAEVARFDTLGYVSGVATTAGGDDDIIYVASGGDLRVVDIGDPQAPRLVEVIPIPGEANDLAIDSGQGNKESYLFLAEGPLFQHRQWLGGGLRIFSLQQGRLKEAAFVDTPGQAQGVELSGHLVYLADGGAGLRVYEAAHPAEPKEMAVQDLGSEVRDVAVGRGRIHIAAFGRGISAGVATAPGSVTIDYRYEAVVFVRGLGQVEDRAQDGLLYVAESLGDPDPVLTGRRGQDDGLHILAVDRPDAVRQVGFVATPGDIRNLTVLGAGERNRVRLAVADGDGGLLFLEEVTP